MKVDKLFIDGEEKENGYWRLREEEGKVVYEEYVVFGKDPNNGSRIGNFIEMPFPNVIVVIDGNERSLLDVLKVDGIYGISVYDSRISDDYGYRDNDNFANYVSGCTMKDYKKCIIHELAIFVPDKYEDFRKVSSITCKVLGKIDVRSAADFRFSKPYRVFIAAHGSNFEFFSMYVDDDSTVDATNIAELILNNVIRLNEDCKCILLVAHSSFPSVSLLSVVEYSVKM